MHITPSPRPSRPPSSDPRTSLLDSPTRPIQVIQDEDARPRDRGVLIQMNGLECGRLFAITRPMTFGRGSRCDVRFDDVTLSREHTRLLRAEGAFFLEDCDSLNGSFVNDERVRRVELADGDRVRLASGARFRFQIVDEEEERGLIRLYESAVRDGLTGVFNRKFLDARMSTEVAFAVRHGTDLALVLFDLDHFKRVNDSRGHLAGDAVLQRVAELASSVLRAEDVLARFGGEEFAVLARGTSAVNAARLAERLRATVDETEVEFEGEPVHVTLSCGVASLACCAPRRAPKDLVARADRRLYWAKTGGRNRVIARDPP